MMDMIYLVDLLSSSIDLELKLRLQKDTVKVIFLTHHVKITLEKNGIQGALLSNYFNLESWDEVNHELYRYYMNMFQETAKGDVKVVNLDQFDCWSNFILGETNSGFIMVSALERVILSEQPKRIECISDHRDSIFAKYLKILRQLGDHYHIPVSMDSVEI